MDELFQMMLKAAIADALKKEVKPSEAKQQKFDKVSVAKEIAKTNKVLFDAHIEAGFSAEQAIQIVTTIIHK